MRKTIVLFSITLLLITAVFPKQTVKGFVPFIGVYINEDDPNAKKIKVLNVIKNSPAKKAGIKKGDIIKKFGSMALDTPNQFILLLYAHKIGETIPVVLERKGKIIKTKITLGKRADRYAYIIKNLSVVIKYSRIMEMGNAYYELGFLVDNINKQLASYFGVEQGVLIKYVRKKSEAYKKGLIAGAIITKINGHKIYSTVDFRKALDSVSKKMTITFKKHSKTYKITLEKRQ